MSKKLTDYFISKNKRPPSQQEEFIEKKALMNPRKNIKTEENKFQLPLPPVVKIAYIFIFIPLLNINSN